MRRREFLISLVGAMTAWPFTAPVRASGARDWLEPALTATQGSKIWRALRKHAGRTQEPAGLKIGEVVPDTMNLLSFDHSLRKAIPAIRPYRYTLVHDQVLVVDPETKKIVSIIGQ
jgi:hypothetical protein